MRIKRLTITNFRSIQNLDIAIDQDFIVLVGPNGSGKTSFLESIFYSSILTAFPPGKSWELIRFGETYFRVTTEIEDAKLEFYYGKKDEKRFERSQSLNGVRKKSGEILGELASVTFLPQDLNLLQLAPSLRRDYLDEILLQTEPGYEESMTAYGKVLSQRNELLSHVNSRQSKPSELDFWDEKLAESASFISDARKRLADFIDNSLSAAYKNLVNTELPCRFKYLRREEDLTPAGFVASLKKFRNEDIASQRTSVGPHRDDWKIFDAEGRDLSRFLSRGEQRSLIISLKMLELKYLKEALGEDPVILLDELLAELDPARKISMLKSLPAGSQKFLTTTDIAEIPESILANAQVLELRK